MTKKLGESADENVQGKAHKQDKTEGDLAVSDMQLVLSTMAGRRVIFRMLDFCKLFESTFSEGHAVMSEREGRRSVGLYLFDQMCEVSPKVALEVLGQDLEEEQ